ncbi:MAG TPA: plastocyanin/azurin family copper-binding protein [Gaiellaceae bacterium]
MLRRLLLPLAILAVSLTAVAVGNAGTQKSPGLTGEVGPGFSIQVKLAGKDLKTIKAGTYTIKVQDKASIHDFHLKGPGLNKATTMPFVGTQTWKITLKPGKYTFQCDPHAAAGMKGTFKVTA